MDPSVARRLWTLYEPVHALTYFAPAVTSAWSDAGVSGFWRGYFAGRAAPLGPAASSAEVVTATFFGFAPEMVARAIPSVWSLVAPADAVAVRLAGAVAALDELLGPVADEEAEAADLLQAAAEAAGSSSSGRVLAAANVALPWPSGIRARLWHAATILREHRGDGHVAALVAADLTGLEANVLAVAAGPLTAARFQQVRGWDPDRWHAAETTLRDRSLVAVAAPTPPEAVGSDTPTGGATALTPAGAVLRASVEAATDAASLRPWEALGAGPTARLETLLAPIVDRLLATDVIPDPNPIGVPRPG